MLPDQMLLELKMTGVLNGNYCANIIHLTGPRDEALCTINFSDGSPIWHQAGIASALDEINDASGGLLDYYLRCCPVGFSLRTMQLRGVGISNGDPTPTMFVLGSNVAVLAGADLDATDGLRTGETSGDAAGPGVAFLTETARRIGKVFFPGLSEADAAAGVLVSGLLTVLGQFIAFLSTGAFEINTASLYFGVYKRASSNGGDPLPSFIATVGGRIGYYIWNQRKRRTPI